MSILFFVCGLLLLLSGIFLPFQDKVWGRAFHVQGVQEVSKALDHLGVRECELGGYCCISVNFTCNLADPDCENLEDDRTKDQLKCLCFYACDNNQWFLGDAPLDQMASEITIRSGVAGHNVEYVTRLADYSRRYLPFDKDPHLFTLDALIRTLILQRGICLHCLISSYHSNTLDKDHVLLPGCTSRLFSTYSRPVPYPTFCCSDCHFEDLLKHSTTSMLSV